MSAKQISIGLLWHSANSGNLGVGALTVSNLALARETAERLGLKPKFLVIGMRDAGERYITDPDVEIFNVNTVTLLSPFGYWRAIKPLNCILDIGGGDSFTEIYGFKRFMFLWLTKMLASVRGIPLLLSPQTIGPLTKFPYKFLAKVALRQAVAIFARDPSSLDLVLQLAPKVTAMLSVDVAFLLPFQVMSAQRGATDVVKVGVNVSGLLFDEAETRSNKFGLEVNYAELMRKFLASLSERKNFEVHLFVHVNGPIGSQDDDSSITDKLASEFPRAIRVPNFASPSAAKSYISSLNFLVAGRMHACIAALSTGTPFVPVAYSRKFSGLFGMLEYPWLVPVTGKTTDEAFDYICDCLDRRDELATSIKTGMQRIGPLIEVYQRELGVLFGSVAALI